MKKMDLKLLNRLMNSYGLSGNEESVREIIKDSIKSHVDTVSTDKMGNLIANEHVSKGDGKTKVMLAAHMDEIGLMVNSIGKYGRLYLSPIGGVEPLSILGQKVTIKSKKGNVEGVITVPDLSDGFEIEKLPVLDDMYVETGLNREQLEKIGIGIGSYVALTQTSGFLANKDLIYGKALDDRIGCFILIEVAKSVKKAYDDVFYVFTVQEEVGLYGAKTAAYHISPDWAIAVDTTNTDDTFKNPTKICGGGPALTYKDFEMISNRKLNDEIELLAKKMDIPIQRDVSDMGTTDALSISISRKGVPSTSLNVPVKNLHSTIGISSLQDIQDTIDLLRELLKKRIKFSGKW